MTHLDENSWHDSMINFLMDYQFPNQWCKDKRRQLALRSKKFTVIAGQLSKKGINQVFRICVPEHEKMGILQEAHQGIAGGHSEKEDIMRKL